MFSLLLYLSNWCNKCFLWFKLKSSNNWSNKRTDCICQSHTIKVFTKPSYYYLDDFYTHHLLYLRLWFFCRKPGDIINISSGCNDDVICLTGSCSVINMQIRWHQGIPPPDDGDSTKKSFSHYFHRIECIGVWRCCKSSVWILSRMNENLTTLMCQSSQLSGFGEVQDCIGVRDTVTMHCCGQYL